MGLDKLIILVAEDNEDDIFLLQRAFSRVNLRMPVHFCRDGEDALKYLQGMGEYADRQKFPFPRVLITDLKMPKVSGFELLQWLSNHPECKLIPTIVLSASRNENDVTKAYQLGANCYFVKPRTLDELTNLVKLAMDFWKTSEVPPLLPQC